MRSSLAGRSPIIYIGHSGSVSEFCKMFCRILYNLRQNSGYVISEFWTNGPELCDECATLDRILDTSHPEFCINYPEFWTSLSRILSNVLDKNRYSVKFNFSRKYGHFWTTLLSLRISIVLDNSKILDTLISLDKANNSGKKKHSGYANNSG